MVRDSPGRSNKPRTALGDLTNQLGKRGFSLISRNPASKSTAGNLKKIKENDFQLTKRISLRGKDSVVEVSGAKCTNAGKCLPLLKGGKTYRLLSLGNADSVLDSSVKAANQFSAESNLGVLGSVNALPDVVERDDIKESGVCSQSASESSKYDLFNDGKIQAPEQMDESQAPQAEAMPETLSSQTASTDGKDSGISTIPSTECPPLVGSSLTKLKSTKPFELEKCMWLKGDATSSAAAGTDSLDACSCSFCMKAAYIWSDLHYMDVKGRISALMKSKKEANNLVRMYSLDDDTVRSREGSSNAPSELEIDLINRCKSLFVCMEDTFGKECNQLEAEILSLKDIRENFKMNLGQIDEMPPEVQHCAADSSAGEETT